MSNGRRSTPTLPASLLRDAVAREVARISLRRAAREICISPNGLRNFLNGSAPRTSTRTKLERWLAAESKASRPPVVGQLVRLLNELAADLSQQQAIQLGRDIAELVASAYQSRKLSPPHWVQELTRRYGARRQAQKDEVA